MGISILRHSVYTYLMILVDLRKWLRGSSNGIPFVCLFRTTRKLKTFETSFIKSFLKSFLFHIYLFIQISFFKWNTDCLHLKFTLSLTGCTAKGKVARLCPWYNGYRRRKWTWRHEFKSWTRLIAFHIAQIPLGKVWIQLFSLQRWVNSRAD